MYVLGCPWVLVPNGTSSWAQLKWKANVLAFQSCSVFQGPRASSPETRIRTHLPFLQGPAPMPLLASSLGSLLLYPSLHTHPVLQEFCSARPVKSLHLLYTVPGSEVGVTGRSRPQAGIRAAHSPARYCQELWEEISLLLSLSASVSLSLSPGLVTCIDRFCKYHHLGSQPSEESQPDSNFIISVTNKFSLLLNTFGVIISFTGN